MFKSTLPGRSVTSHFFALMTDHRRKVIDSMLHIIYTQQFRSQSTLDSMLHIIYTQQFRSQSTWGFF